MPSPRVALLRALPAEGLLSIDRFGDELCAALAERGEVDAFQFAPPRAGGRRGPGADAVGALRRLPARGQRPRRGRLPRPRPGLRPPRALAARRPRRGHLPRPDPAADRRRRVAGGEQPARPRPLPAQRRRAAACGANRLRQRGDPHRRAALPRRRSRPGVGDPAGARGALPAAARRAGRGAARGPRPGPAAAPRRLGPAVQEPGSDDPGAGAAAARRDRGAPAPRRGPAGRPRTVASPSRSG